MPAKIFSAALFGFDCKMVEVEVDIQNGPASITIVGLGDISVQESKERLRSAIKNSGLIYPRKKKTINLAPANLPKHGPLYDLPIALGLLLQSEQIPPAALEKTIAIGELGLDGSVRRVTGVLPILAHAKEMGFSQAIVPFENAAEASVLTGIQIIPAVHLREVTAYLQGKETELPKLPRNRQASFEYDSVWSFEDIQGHEMAKRALTIAAAGGHNVLLFGPPGSGKTLLARSLQKILPPLTFEQAIEVMKLYSIAGKLPDHAALIRIPPFRAIHHTASAVALIGGGSIPKPGEISLAHHGVLFLDELLEFSRSVLDVLRQPIEEGQIHISRAKASVVFPAKFMFLAATNPCPCGYFGDPIKPCLCNPTQRNLYRRKLSGPLLDRIDLVCSVPRLPIKKMSEPVTLRAHETTPMIRERVLSARRIQLRRYGVEKDGLPYTNGKLPLEQLRIHCTPTFAAQNLLDSAGNAQQMSGRVYHKILKVARTIADLDGSKDIDTPHIAEALQFRPRFEEE